jgi:heat-inducible transcriptional repressor
MSEILNERDREILEILISDYIATALPVGSKTISKKHRGRYSAATIRSIMADLEKMGLLRQPHTSAGRIPTARGVRYYIDSILQCRELSSEEKKEVRRRYADAADLSVDEIIGRTSKVLSAISRHVGLVSTSNMDQVVFKHIQFLPLSSRRLLCIFVSQEGFVQNKIVEVDREYTYPDLEKINNYCNSAFLGLTLEDARRKIIKETERIKKDYDHLLSRALIFSKEVFQAAAGGDIVFDGESHLVGEPEFLSAEKLRNILFMLEEKKQLIHILDRCKEADKVNIFIGAEVQGKGFFEENPDILKTMESVSVVTAPFKKDGRVLGTLGVIGPIRMDYSRVVPVVDFTAKLLEDILN